jgi:hypothetical protein
MTDRTTELEATVHAQDALIAEAQRLLPTACEQAAQVATPSSSCAISSKGRASARRSVWCGKRWARISATTREAPRRDAASKGWPIAEGNGSEDGVESAIG